ncbi:endo-1,4-beta-xylanase [Consotaella salsifontis]|nr:endo-1,4-beta-xylanase [Consotaella salsifontis]
MGLALAAGEVAPTIAAPARRRVPFGGAIQAEHFDVDPEYRKAFLTYCDLIMPMNELKFDLLRPSPDVFSFEPADRIVDFALSHGKGSRGHCFLWWGGTPDWVKAITDPKRLEAVLIEHIETVADHYAGRLTSWDVVNEVIANDPPQEGALRDTHWLRVLGPRHIPLAFLTAAKADPKARLVINDYDLEYVGPRCDARRATMLAMVRQLKDAGVPVHAVGMQGHLYADLQIDHDAIAAFGAALKAIDVGLIVSELDIIDWHIEGGPAEQDAAAGKAVNALLDAVFAGQQPEAVIAWGLTDRYSWVGGAMPRPDGTPVRPLPLDEHYRRKAWFGPLLDRLKHGR